MTAMLPPLTRARARAVLAAAAAVLVLGGCEDSGGEPQPEPSADVGGTSGRPIAAGDEYVALGDSYAAAPFTGKPDGDDGCYRSLNNYPHLVAGELDLVLTDVSCGGARTTDMTGRQTTIDDTVRPPQLDALSRSTDLVTFSAGGNDFNLFGTLVYNCVGLAQGDPGGAPCTQLDVADGDSNVASALEDVEDRLVRVIEEIGERAPRARVLVVGFPQFAPAERICEEFPLAAGDYPLGRKLNVLLDEALRGAAERSGAEFVDVFAATKGHDICSRDPWIAGVEPEGGRAAEFHPYAAEQRVVAELIVEQLAS